jgi:hypothetical protein
MAKRLTLWITLFLTITILYNIFLPVEKERASSDTELSSLHTQGNKVISTDTNKPIILRGVVSDYFRYGFNNKYPSRYGGLQSELEKISHLKQTGANINIIGLYLARLDKIKSNIEELDQYIDYARENGIYVFLAPAGIGFLETNPKKENMVDENYWKFVGENDLAEITKFLASRYGNHPNILYQLTAEPNISYPAWEVKQRELAEIVRKYSDNPIIVSTPYYSAYSPLPILSFNNIIYSAGGYVRKNDNSFTERQISEILGEESLRQDYPVIVAEFGGNYGGNFSSDQDLLMLKEILGSLHHENMSYTLYRLSSAFPKDGLALFDTESKLNQKGQVFVNIFD